MASQKRKTNYIDNHVQGALLRRIFSHWLTFFGVAGIAVILLQSMLGDSDLSLTERIKHQAGEFTFFAMVMAALLPAFMLDTTRFSNRFVGPITRLRRHLRELAEGETDKCSFRGEDFWQELAGELNAVADLVAEQQKEIDRLKSAAGDLEKSTAN